MVTKAINWLVKVLNDFVSNRLTQFTFVLVIVSMNRDKIGRFLGFE